MFVVSQIFFQLSCLFFVIIIKSNQISCWVALILIKYWTIIFSHRLSWFFIEMKIFEFLCAFVRLGTQSGLLVCRPFLLAMHMCSPSNGKVLIYGVYVFHPRLHVVIHQVMTPSLQLGRWNKFLDDSRNLTTTLYNLPLRLRIITILFNSWPHRFFCRLCPWSIILTFECFEL